MKILPVTLTISVVVAGRTSDQSAMPYTDMLLVSDSVASCRSGATPVSQNLEKWSDNQAPGRICGGGGRKRVAPRDVCHTPDLADGGPVSSMISSCSDVVLVLNTVSETTVPDGFCLVEVKRQKRLAKNRATASVSR